MIKINIAAFITVRLASTRLPKKALIDIKGKPTIVHLIERIKHAKNLKKIVLCTTSNPEDNELIKIAQEQNIDYFAGDEKDIIKRHYDAAVYHDIDFTINVDGDDLFCDPSYIDEIINEAKHNFNKYDVIKTQNLPFGVNSFGYKRIILKKILEQKEEDDTDTGWGECLKNTEDINIKIINAKEHHTKIDARMSLDYQEDYEFFKAIFEGLYSEDKYFSLDDIFNYLKKNPKIILINKSAEEKFWQHYKGKKMKKKTLKRENNEDISYRTWVNGKEKN